MNRTLVVDGHVAPPQACLKSGVKDTGRSGFLGFDQSVGPQTNKKGFGQTNRETSQPMSLVCFGFS